MISRVADHCFWLGRYVERAESTARVLQVTRNLSLDAGLPVSQCWYPVVVVSGEESSFLERFGAKGLEDGEMVQRYLAWDEDNLSSIRRSLAAARENTRSVREVVSLETWEALNEVHLWMSSAEAETQYRHDRHAFYRHVRRTCQLVLGLLPGTMLHEDAFDFIFLGVMLERAGQTARVLDVHHHTLTQPRTHQVVETALWLSLLRSCSGFEPFMKRNRGPITPLAVASFLVLEPAFPRSVRYSIDGACHRLVRIRSPDAVDLPGARGLERLQALRDWIARQPPDALQPGAIHELLTRVVDETAAICDGIGQELLGHTPPASSPAAAQ